MRKLKYILSFFLITALTISCNQDDDNLNYVDAIPAPTNLSAAVTVTQDNSGLVTITPLGEGVVNYSLDLGDGSELTEEIQPGGNVQHTYEEGVYNLVLTGFSLNGKSTTINQELVVSFQAPQNLEVTISNDDVVSKQVNVMATAEFALSYQVDFGDGSEPIMANIEDGISYVYEDAGTYTITVTAFSAAIETTVYTEEFEVTAIVQPLTSAPTPPNRADSDVISIFSSAYINVPDTNYFPDWGQANQGSGWAMFDLAGDEILQYVNLSYQGIELASGTTVDVSNMEYLHLDVWTADAVTQMETSIINNASGVVTEAPVTSPLNADSWTSIEIPISDYTDQGLTVTEIFQLKFVANGTDEWAAGTVFIDNIYFYKESDEPGTGVTPITFETEFELSSFDGGGISLVDNPDTNGNNSSMVAEMIKGSGQTWAGSKITIPTPFNVTASTVVTAKVWSPRVGLELLMKMEDDVPWPGVTGTAEIIATSTVANQWETLTFDFSGIDTAINWYNLVLIMDNGVMGDGSSDYTIYIDDISTDPMLDFEPNFTLSSFDGGGISVIDNPDTNGNNSNMVAEVVKGSGQTWAGSKITVPTPFEVTSSSVITAKVWSPRVGLELLMKLEDDVPWPGVTGTADVVATSTVANQWETLTFDFSGIDTAIDWYNLVLIIDNGIGGDGSADYTIYIDDIALN